MEVMIVLLHEVSRQRRTRSRQRTRCNAVREMRALLSKVSLSILSMRAKMRSKTVEVFLSEQLTLRKVRQNERIDI